MLVHCVLIPKPSVSVTWAVCPFCWLFALLYPFGELQSFWLPCLVLMPSVLCRLEGR